MVIKPKYKVTFLPLFQDIDKIFEEQGEVIYHQRNTIKVIEWGGHLINVKKYAVPNLINQIAYRWLRPSKAQRAYEYASVLNERGISTPESIGYIVRKGVFGVRESYLVTFQSSLRRNFYEFDRGGASGREEIIRGLARFAADMHHRGFLHKDFSPGNILFDSNQTGTYDYTVVDINRMRFGPVSLEAGCANFQRLWGDLSFLRILADAYAEARSADPDEVYRLIYKYHSGFWRGRNRWY